jgi:signal transduction histidine kinase
LFERQLPHIAGRLQAALDKLQTPQRGVATLGSATEWWRLLCEHSDQRRIEFVDAIEADRPIPIELFDSVLENLLDNARAKQALDPAVQIQVRLRATADGVELEVMDSGAPVPAPKTDELGRRPVSSETGLGIGLYQAARHAELLGYRLSLVANEAGHVMFRLAPSRAAEDAAQSGSFPPAPGGAADPPATADARR